MEKVFLNSSDGRASLAFQKSGNFTHVTIYSTVLVGEESENKLKLSVLLPTSFSHVMHSMQIFLSNISNSILEGSLQPQKTRVADDSFTIHIMDKPNFILATDKRACEILIKFSPRCMYQMIFLLDVTVIDIWLEAAKRNEYEKAKNEKE